jgi:hypothetical protein
MWESSALLRISLVAGKLNLASEKQRMRVKVMQKYSAYLMSKNGHIAVFIPNDESGSRPATSTWRMGTSRRRAPNRALA